MVRSPQYFTQLTEEELDVQCQKITYWIFSNCEKQVPISVVLDLGNGSLMALKQDGSLKTKIIF